MTATSAAGRGTFSTMTRTTLLANTARVPARSPSILASTRVAGAGRSSTPTEPAFAAGPHSTRTTRATLRARDPQHDRYAYMRGLWTSDVASLPYGHWVRSVCRAGLRLLRVGWRRGPSVREPKQYLTCSHCGVEVPLPHKLPEGMEGALVTLNCPICGGQSRDYVHELTPAKEKRQ